MEKWEPYKNNKNTTKETDNRNRPTGETLVTVGGVRKLNHYSEHW